MLFRTRELEKYSVEATDGDIGHVDDIYFDDRTGAVRYVVVDTNDWLPGGKVLAPTAEIEMPDAGESSFPVDLTRKQVRNQPPISFDRPISRQVEADVHRHHGWQPYWVRGPFEGPVPGLFSDQSEGDLETKQGTTAVAESEADSHLRSCNELRGYKIVATDGDVGIVTDLVIDPDNWSVRYLIVDTGDWLKSRKVLLSASWVDNISWTESEFAVGLSRDTIKDSPEFDPDNPIERQYEEALYNYYGRKKYWKDK